ncbi:GNAT family N-acetyltransferase [Thermococcus argininiproducens]|uniref:GNAT family N-acetyltransferase n=1 Tax=Thermococcus argininiproducens TaxID=2866384 RepID=A0A9E7MAE6_9EURY|nr:GNAT family N-acetyltransferase [Thermococcus argininiproducens]USG99646.1 GNAT family N-acetyltransferase [Thermococcus argininiproducens]
MQLEAFYDALISTYCENPCQVLPNALWKTLKDLSKFDTSFRAENGLVTHLEAWKENELYVYWNRSRNPPKIPKERLNGLKFALVHQDFLRAFPIERFDIKVPYFRLIHKKRQVREVELPQGFHIVDVDAKNESNLVAEVIKRCYENINVTPEIVKSWTKHPVFDPNLWIWIIDSEKGNPAGLGIAELDPTVREGSLEWIQVLPEYRGRGIGKTLVLELLRRFQDRAAFTTVSGEVNNKTKPELLYRRCGFRGNDVWWLLIRKQTGV